MDRISQIGGNIADFAIEQVVRHLRYVIDYESNLDNLKGKLEDLVDVKGRVEHKVDEALSKSQKIEADVGKWLKRVEDIIAQARKLLEDENHARIGIKVGTANGCSSHKGKRISKCCIHRSLQRTLTVISGFQAFESRTSIVTQILEEFRKDDMNMIGVYGMAGVGKSTFAKQIANQAREERLFDNVGEAEVKQNPDVKSIQNKLALSFGLHLDKTQTIDEWLLILRNYIKDKKKKILIIFDDIWEMLDLKTLGLDEGYCKILLTSRDGEMLRSEMGTQKNFRLDILDEAETWNLFEKKVGDAVKHPDIREVATRIAKRCGGLPILVETMARTLRGKPIHSWNDALTRLNRSDGKGLPEKVHLGIEWSYNQLDDEDVKSLFLIGGMISDGYMSLSDLLKYTMGLSLKLFEGIDTVEKAYDRLQSSVDKLKESCLLLDTNDSQTFKMHDLTLDVAKNIASRAQHFLSYGNKNEFKEWPNKELLRKCAMMSINRINISKLPEELECRGLHLFKFYSKDKSLQIPPNLFKDTEQLEVLDLTYLCIPSLPPSIQSLTSLQTLCLDQCELRDIAIVGELRNLEILSFLYSKFKQLPKEIARLTRLRWLDLRGCPELEVVCPDVIKSLTSLEELNMNNSFNNWETKEASNNIRGRRNASLSELKHLPKLTTLGINIKDANQLPINFFSERLKHFEIIIGDVWDWDDDRASKMLKLKLSQRNQWDQGLEAILKRCEDLSLDVFEGVNNIVYQLDMDGFQRLKKLHVQNNPEILHIVNSNIGHTWIHSHAAFPILEELSLCDLGTFESVCSGQLAIESFRQLKVIKVQSCPKLKKLFSLSTISHFLQLQQIEVVNCNTMKEIIVGEKQKQLTVEANDPIEFHGLQSLSMQGLPELTCFASNPRLHETSTCTDPLQLFNHMVVFPKLENLKLSSIPLNKLWDSHFSERMSWIQNLTSLIVDGCDGLSFLCSSSMAINFVQLKNLLIRSCQNMVNIISTEEALGNMQNMFPKLQTLQLLSLGKLEIFCTCPTYIEFPCLELVVIKDCINLGSFIIDSTRRKNVADPFGYHLFDENVGFPNLEDLRMEGLYKLTTIWHTQLAPDSFYKLTFVSVESCPSLTHIIGPGILKRLHSLKELYVEDCESVQEVFTGDDDQSEVFTCQNLLQVIIRGCKSLKIVFPPPVVRVLVKLEILLISECEILEIIVGEEDQIVGEIIPNFVFPRVESLGLWDLPQLRSFYPGMHTSMWASLRKLWLRPSDEIERLAEEYSIFQQQHQHDQLVSPTKLPILLFQKGSFCHLEEFQFVLIDGIELPLEFLEAKRLYVIIASVVGQLIILKKFRNLQQLDLFYGDMEEIFIDGGVLDGQEQHVFAHLKTLGISGMKNLIQVWKDSSHLAVPVFPNLEFLDVKKCGRLKNIVSSAITFRNLVQLEVLECHGLKHLFTCSVAKSLVKLQSISVENCKRMIEIVASIDDKEDIDDAAENEIAFCRLKELKLSQLPKLRGFCSRNYNVIFPFLTTLRVTSCLEINISVDGILLNDSKYEGGVALMEDEEEEEEEEEDDDDDEEEEEEEEDDDDDDDEEEEEEEDDDDDNEEGDDDNNIEDEDNGFGERFQVRAAE
ncbi:hypothetical protein FNV43_RR08618 [Rhamnella rubrinervis]|uniref:AAA+ ATPase domain-containing protein n=1 Tax=Rhamnella rubrinervis TaxID=2594499 RepID=A0A8K0H8X2_9ROSA|nr:hypothetical protein FNV43_RR08618 [Rhamnella rubrinervis]